MHFSIDAKQAATEEMRELAKDVGDERVVAQLDDGATAATLLVGRFGARSRVKIGDQVEVAVDTRALHFFDPETGSRDLRRNHRRREPIMRIRTYASRSSDHAAALALLAAGLAGATTSSHAKGSTRESSRARSRSTASGRRRRARSSSRT